MISPMFFNSQGTDLRDSIDGPYSVYEDQECTYCGSKNGVVIKNVHQECVFELCGCCGFEKDYEERGMLN